MPGISVYDVCELLPKFDCGLCGNPTCTTFARRVLYRTQEPHECIYASEEDLSKIEKIAANTPAVDRKHTLMNGGCGEIDIFPCTEDGKVTLEFDLGSDRRASFDDFFDEYQLCASLSEGGVFEKINCSPKMGYALVEMGDKRAHVFKTGKIILRRAVDRKDALDALGRLSRMLLPARISPCGNILADCFGGGCGTCSQEEGAHVDTREVLKGKPGRKNEKLAGNLTALSALTDVLRGIDLSIREDKLEAKDELNCRMGGLLTQINENCIQVISDGIGEGDTVLALLQYGLTRDLARAGSGFLDLATNKADGLYDQATHLLFSAMDAYEAGNAEKLTDHSDMYSNFVSNWKERSAPMELAKIAANGFYIARILGGKVPPIEPIDKFEE